MEQGPGEFHSFPTLVDVFGGDGEIVQIQGGDGLMYTAVRIWGGYGQYDGYFEYIIGPDGTINHRFFVVVP